MDFGNSHSSEYALISEDNYSNSALYGSNTVDDDTNPNYSFDLLGAEDPLEWLIETDCTQQYLPESSLPLFPFHTITSDHNNNNSIPDDYDDKLHIHSSPNDDIITAVVDAAIDSSMAATTMPRTTITSNHSLLRMTDPNVTMQSLLLPTSCSTSNSGK